MFFLCHCRWMVYQMRLMFNKGVFEYFSWFGQETQATSSPATLGTSQMPWQSQITLLLQRISLHLSHIFVWSKTNRIVRCKIPKSVAILFRLLRLRFGCNRQTVSFKKKYIKFPSKSKTLRKEKKKLKQIKRLTYRMQLRLDFFPRRWRRPNTKLNCPGNWSGSPWSLQLPTCGS